MVLYPEVQKKAQAEIDTIIGPNRLPDFGDRSSLPYINAVVKEVMRWHLVAPLGKILFIITVIPSLSVLKLFPTWLVTKMNMMVIIFQKEQLCLAMHGQCKRSLLLSVLIFLIRSILHDPKTFNNPMEYQPERYLKDGKLNPDVVDPDSVAFGFGRRLVDLLLYSVMRHISHRRSIPLSICPGRHLADNSLYLLACCLLAVYDINPPVDNQGNTIKFKAEFTSGLIS